MTDSSSIVASSQAARYSFLDLYRGLFVVLMLEGHFVRALLLPEIKAGSLFTFHELIHGITAPGFFFGAGFAFAISTSRRWDVVTRFSWGWARRAGRAFMLIAVGYSLHAPYLSLQKTIAEGTADQWEMFLSFGVLQCIGIALVFLYLLLVLLRNDRLFYRTTALLVPVLVYLTPSVSTWSLDPAHSLWLRSALNTVTGSPYPIFPFAGFVFAGVVCAWLFLRAEESDAGGRFVRRMLLAGFLLMVFAWVSERFLFSSPDENAYWTTGPNFFWMRLGILLVVLAALWFLEKFIVHQWFPRWLTVLGVESFFVYLFHLIVLYWWVVNAGIHLLAFFGGTLDVPRSFLCFLLFLPVMYYGARIWRTMKKRHALLLRGLLIWAALGLAYAFLTYPY